MNVLSHHLKIYNEYKVLLKAHIKTKKYSLSKKY